MRTAVIAGTVLALATVAPLMGTGNFVKNIQSNYATPLIEVNTKCVVTNTTPVSAYRGDIRFAVAIKIGDYHWLCIKPRSSGKCC